MNFQTHDINILDITAMRPDGMIQVARPEGLTVTPGDYITFQTVTGTVVIGFLRTWDITPDGHHTHARPDAHYRVEDVSEDGTTLELRHDPRVIVEYLDEDDGYQD